MATFICSNICWDCDGANPYKLGLPKTVIVLNVPDEKLEFIYSYNYEDIGDCLSDTYGFCHNGFDIELIQGDEPGNITHWSKSKFPLPIAFMQCPNIIEI